MVLSGIRVIHGCAVASHIFRLLTESEENELLHMIMKATEIWTYLMGIGYLQFYVMF